MQLLVHSEGRSARDLTQAALSQKKCVFYILLLGSEAGLLRLIRVLGGFDPAGQSVCGGLRELTPYQLHHGVA